MINICQKLSEKISYLIPCVYLIVESLFSSLLLLREQYTSNAQRDPSRGRHGEGQRSTTRIPGGIYRWDDMVRANIECPNVQ